MGGTCGNTDTPPGGGFDALKKKEEGMKVTILKSFVTLSNKTH